MAQKSLFSYFKSPGPGDSKKIRKADANSAEDEQQKENIASNDVPSTPPAKVKRRNSVSPNESRNSGKKKRRRIIESDSGEEMESSGDEFKPEPSEASQEEESDEMSEGESEPEMTTPKHKRTKLSSPKTPLSRMQSSENTFAASSPSPNVRRKTIDKLSSFSAPPENTQASASSGEGIRYHHNLEFLKPGSIKDKNGKRSTDEGYDCRTLYVPKEFMNSTTPAMRQWWELKENHYDTVLFFKMGKFYEFFHMDADVGVKELGLVYMKGNYAHAGFPEIAYGRYADTLLRKGYKIARVEQTETPDMMNDRIDQSSKKVTKFDKVVKREVCQITTPGTRTPNFLDGESIDVTSNYLLAVCEKVIDKGYQIGVCFVDTSVGKIFLGQFDDDIYGSRIRTLISHYVPGQILCEKKKLSPLFSHLFKTTLATVLKEYLVPGKEFWDGEKTIKMLLEGGYFSEAADDSQCLPKPLSDMINRSDSVARTPAEGYELAFRSLGAIVWYLGFCYIDHDILSLKSFNEYVPLDNYTVDATRPLSFESSKMVLDSVTLANLDIFTNQTTGTTEGSLIERIDNCKTAGGKRLLREWISAPLCNHRLINDRLDAVTNLMEMADMNNMHNEMKKLPDFERLLSRIHSLGNKKRNEDHPDNRAIMFENEIYSKRKIEGFLSLLTGFRKALDILPQLRSSASSSLLKKCITFKGDGGHLPDLTDLLDYFEESFDHASAKKAGAIHPTKGYVEEYDQSVEEIESINNALQDYLKEQKKLLQSSQVSYVGTGRNRFQLEVPESACKRVPADYEVTGQRKGFRRYVSAETKSFLSQLMEAEDKQIAALKDTMRKIFNKFDENYNQWMDFVQCVNVLDVLMSMASFAMTGEGEMCRPEIVPPTTSEQPLIEIRDGRHPSTIKTFGGGNFIPNDTVIGCHINDDDNNNSNAEVLLLTGPNMGGKSTLMRQVALLTVMAQLGSYVPASKFRLTPVDRLFTRLGASDRIMHGESTFFVELSETSIILQHATKYSLVLLDELGRGTATHDGTAIACAVLKELAENIKCRTIFSTHYHSLVDDFLQNSNVQLGHMACLVNESSSDRPDHGETITFLYKLAPDFCPKSYGFNVARLAGLPEQVIKLGLQKTQELERITELRRCMRAILLAEEQEKVNKVRSICV